MAQLIVAWLSIRVTLIAQIEPAQQRHRRAFGLPE
jgi:hypothetical protein